MGKERVLEGVKPGDWLRSNSGRGNRGYSYWQVGRVTATRIGIRKSQEQFLFDGRMVGNHAITATPCSAQEAQKDIQRRASERLAAMNRKAEEKYAKLPLAMKAARHLEHLDYLVGDADALCKKFPEDVLVKAAKLLGFEE